VERNHHNLRILKEEHCNTSASDAAPRLVLSPRRTAIPRGGTGTACNRFRVATSQSHKGRQNLLGSVAKQITLKKE